MTACVDQGRHDCGLETGCRVRSHWPAVNGAIRSEEHTSELQSLMRISYAVFCLKKKKTSPFTPQSRSESTYDQYTDKKDSVYAVYKTKPSIMTEHTNRKQ